MNEWVQPWSVSVVGGKKGGAFPAYHSVFFIIPLTSFSFFDWLARTCTHAHTHAHCRLAPPVDGGSVPRTWIVYNRPRSPSHAHGGLLMALGLQARKEGRKAPQMAARVDGWGGTGLNLRRPAARDAPGPGCTTSLRVDGLGPV